MKLTPDELVRWNNRVEKERALAERAADPTFNPEVKRNKLDDVPKIAEIPVSE